VLDLLVQLNRWLQFGLAAALFGPLLYRTIGLQARSVGTWSSQTASLAGLGTGLFVTSLLAILVQARLMAGDDGPGLDGETLAFVIEETTFGVSCAVRAFLCLTLVSAAVLLPPGAGRSTMVLVLAGLATASLAWSGHGAEQSGGLAILHLGNDILHILSASLWIGALLVFCLDLLPLWGLNVETAGYSTLSALRQFSGLGSLIAAILLVTGAVNTLLITDGVSLTLLAGSDYGRTLALKVTLVMIMLALAGFNRWVALPKLAREVEDTAAHLARLRASLLGETLVGAVVLLVVAHLGTLAPPLAPGLV